MKLFDATLDLASFAKGTEDHIVSSVTGKTVYCDTLAGRVSEFGGGTIWIMSGECAGQFGRIGSSAAQTIVTDDLYSELAEGDRITIGAWLEFDTQKLINAVNSVLRLYKIMKFNDELEYNPDTEVYDLPEGVTEDIRRIYIPMKYQDIPSHYWRVENGQLHLYDRHRYRYLEGGGIRICYVDYHGAVGKEDEISSQVDPLYLRYMSWLYLCRNLIQNVHKDNLVASDMYNEAKIYERDHSQLPNKSLGIRNFTFPQW